MKNTAIAILLLAITTVYAGNIDYYQISKLTKQAKNLPNLNSKSKKQQEFKKIQQAVREMNKEEQKIIKPQLEKIYDNNRKIENENREQKMRDIAKDSAAKINKDYYKIKNSRKYH